MKKISPLLAFLILLGTHSAMAEDINVELQQLQQALAVHPDDSQLLYKMGMALYKAGKFAEAEPFLSRSLAIVEKVMGENHPNVAKISLNLVDLYEKQGKYKQAVFLYQKNLVILENNLGKDHSDVAVVLNNFAELYREQGNYVQAESLYLRSLAINEKSVDKDHPGGVANVLNNLAMLYQDQGKYEEAAPLFIRSLAIFENALGTDHLNVSGALKNLALLYRDQGNYAYAEPLLVRSLAIREKALGKDHSEVAEALNNLGLLYQEQGKYAEAEPLLIRSLALREKALGKDHPEVATALNNLALLYQGQGKYAEAEQMLIKSLAISEKALGKNHSDVAKVLNNLASLYQIYGKYAEAEPLHIRSLAISEKALGKDQPDVARNLNGLASLYLAQGKYAEAEPLYIRSLAIYEKALGKDHPEVADCLNNLARLYQEQGRDEQVEALLQKSLVILEKTWGRDHPKVATTLTNLAAFYQKQGKYEKAELFYQRSLAVKEKIFGKDHPSIASSLHNLAGLNQEQENYEQAELLYQRSLTISERFLGKDHPYVADTLGNLGLMYQMQGKYDQAEIYHQKSLSIREKVLDKYHPAISGGLVTLAALYAMQNKYDQAEPLFQKSLRIMNASLEQWLWGAGEKTRQSYLQQEELNRDTYLSFFTLQNTPEEALYFSLSRKGLLLRISSEVSALSKQSHYPAVQKLVQDFNAIRTQLSSMYFSKKANQADIKALEEKSNELEGRLSKQVSSFKRSRSEVTPAQVLENLQPGQSLVDYLVYNFDDFKTHQHTTEQIIALVANQQHGIQLVKLGEYAPIAEALKAYRAKIGEDENGSNKQLLAENAKKLYAQLWQPLTQYLQTTPTVYLVPDGQLNLLPFKALQDKDGNYLATKHQLINLSSARDIVLHQETGKNTQASIFANPDFGGGASNLKKTTRGIKLSDLFYESLPATLQEGQQIKQLFNQKQPDIPAQLFLGKQANEQAVKALHSPKILHLATHGFYLPDLKVDDKNAKRGLLFNPEFTMPVYLENPLNLSGVLFTGANQGFKGIKQADQTDGILTTLEVLNLDLAGTGLVTLSACDTGVGEAVNGEGVYSLNRAFQEAGAKAVLSTLWSVDDEATGIFMQKFYAKFLDGKSAQQAIQETQQDFIQDRNCNLSEGAKCSNPVYWAGFVMTGG